MISGAPLGGAAQAEQRCCHQGMLTEPRLCLFSVSSWETMCLHTSANVGGSGGLPLMLTPAHLRNCEKVARNLHGIQGVYGCCRPAVTWIYNCTALFLARLHSGFSFSALRCVVCPVLPFTVRARKQPIPTALQPHARAAPRWPSWTGTEGRIDGIFASTSWCCAASALPSTCTTHRNRQNSKRGSRAETGSRPALPRMPALQVLPRVQLPVAAC